MSVWGRRISAKVVAAAAAAMVVAALLPVMTSTPVREIRLVARDMSFYLESDPRRANPVLDVAAGERVRIVLTNADRGMTHDFAVPRAGVAMSPIGWNQSTDVTFDVPTAAGTYEYICRPHQLMMRGTIRVH
jgi:plastocyanin